MRIVWNNEIQDDDETVIARLEYDQRTYDQSQAVPATIESVSIADLVKLCNEEAQEYDRQSVVIHDALAEVIRNVVGEEAAKQVMWELAKAGGLAGLQ